MTRMHSIGQYLKTRVFLGITLILMAGSVLLAWAMRSLDVREFDAALETKARTLATLIFQHPGAVEVDFADEYLPEFDREGDREYYQVALLDGTVLDRSESLGPHRLPVFRETAPQPVFRNLELPDGRRGRLVQMAVTPRTDTRAVDSDERDLHAVPADTDTDRPYILLTVAWARQQLDTVLWTIYSILLGMMVLLIVSLMILMRRLLRRGFAPIDDMNRQIRELGPGELHRRVQLAKTPAELQPAIHALNGFLADLERAFAREQRFTSNVAHELRTPVAELRLACEVGAKWPDDPAMVRARFEELRQTALDMERKVLGLLELSRLETRRATVERKPLVLRAVTGDLWSRVATQHNPHRLRFDNRIPEGVRVESDEVKLDMILQNLFFNALSYSVTETVVTLDAVKASDGGLMLRLSNTTDLLQPEDVERIFERFWRKDPARTDGRRLGIGLSLVQSLTELLGIRVRAELDARRTFTIILHFPRAPNT